MKTVNLDAEPPEKTGKVSLLNRELETQTLKAFAKLFDGQLERSDMYFYGHDARELHVLHWNSLGHYDELILREE